MTVELPLNQLYGRKVNAFLSPFHTRMSSSLLERVFT